MAKVDYVLQWVKVDISIHGGVTIILICKTTPPPPPPHPPPTKRKYMAGKL